MQLRDERVDAVRGVEVFSVVFGHNAIFKKSPALYEAVDAFHMPIFLYFRLLSEERAFGVDC